MSSFQAPLQQRTPMGPGMRACGSCGQGTPLGSPDGMCQGCRDQRDAIREEARRRLAASKLGANEGALVVVKASAKLESDEAQEYVDDLPPAPMPPPRPRMAANPMTFPGQGPSPLRPVASGSNTVRRRFTGPLRVGEHRFSQERVAYQNTSEDGAQKPAAASGKRKVVVAVRRKEKPAFPMAWAGMLGGLMLAVGLGSWGLKGGVALQAAAPVETKSVTHVAAQAEEALPTAAQIQAIARAPGLPDRDAASRMGAAMLGAAPSVRYVAPAASHSMYRSSAPVVRPAAPVASSYRDAAPASVAAAPRAYRYAAPAPRAQAPAPRVRGTHRSLAEAMVITSRPGPAPGTPQRQGGVEVIGW